MEITEPFSKLNLLWDVFFVPCQGHYHFRIVFDKHIKYLPDQKQYCQWGDQTSSHDNSNEEKLEQWRERGGYLQLKPPSFLVYWYIRPRWYLRPGMISYDVWISRDMYLIYNDIYIICQGCRRFLPISDPRWDQPISDKSIFFVLRAANIDA